jgi:hypothetical protein
MADVAKVHKKSTPAKAKKLRDVRGPNRLMPEGLTNLIKRPAIKLTTPSHHDTLVTSL